MLTAIETALVAGAALGLAVAILALRWPAPGIFAFSGMAFCTAIWSFTQALQLDSTDPGRILWLAKFQALGSVCILPLWIIFALRATHRDHNLTRFKVALLWVIPVIIILQVWATPTPPAQPPLPVSVVGSPTQFIPVAWQMVWMAYVIFFYAAGTTTIIQSAANYPRLYAREASSLVISTLLPPASIIPILAPQGITLTPLAFVATCLIAGMSLARLTHFELAPLAGSALMESLPDGVLAIDLHDRIVNANPAAARLLNQPVAALTGQFLPNALAGWDERPGRHNEDQGFSISLLIGQAAAPGEENQEIELRRFSLLDQRQRPAGQLCLLRDTTGARRQAEQLRLLSAAIDAAANGIVLTDKTGRIIWANPAFTRITGYSLLEAIDQKPSLLKSGRHDERFYRNLWETILSGQTWHGELINRRRDGNLYYEEMSIAPVRDETGQITHFVAIKQDINDRKRAEDAVIRFNAEKQRLLETAAITQERSRIAQEIHDGLAQNLAALRLRIQRWHRLLDNDPTRLHTELDELQQVLSESLLEVRRSIFALRPLPLASLGFFPALRQYLAGFSEYYPIRVDLDVRGETERIPSRLEITVFRIIQEALNNCARHANARNAWILLDLQDSATLHVCIRDDGQGMDPEHLDHAGVQDHFGLQNIRDRAEKFKGQLQITSQPGQGVKLDIFLPWEEP